MKRLLQLIIACLMALPLMAQQPTAKALLDDASANLRANEGIRAALTIVTDEGEVKATICMKGNKFVLETPGMKTWFDGTTQWTYLEVNEEVNVSTPTAAELQQINPYALMESYRTGYDLTLTANHQAKSFYEITLKAQTSQQPVERVVLLLNKKTLHPIRIKAKQQGAPGMAEVIVTEYKTKQPYTNDFFQFNPAEYPQAEVIDLR
ncbi:MAG: hypothetical protein J6R28_07370 [Bacteroides sp.]|nr:hypothetical protein [Bacteroides sp.]MBQ5818558.1 hypothetical protein [Bacteroides sp.]